MSLLEDIFERTPKGNLFHYTNQFGFLGIINNKEIWASHTQYLNDHKEYIHAVSLAKQVIEDVKHKHKSDIELEILEDMHQGIEGGETINVCVCSFSEEPDSLSQWRAYGGSSGFSIGFNSSFIKSVIKKHEFKLAPCLYRESEQIELLEAIIQKVLKTNITLKEEDQYDHFPKGGEFRAVMHRYAPIFKDIKFEEEKEWRIISRPLSCDSEKFDFRPGKSMLIPYYKIPLIDEGGLFDIEEVIVGPTPNLEQSIHSTNSFLVRNELESTKASPTDVPFRNW